MANLNFTRNIGSASSLGRTSVNFASSALSGHVTPVLGQRTLTDTRRTLPGIGGSGAMGTMTAMGGYSTQNTYNSLHSVFGSSDTSTPPLLDLSEFPSLTNRSAAANESVMAPQATPMPANAKPYVGMVKQANSETSEFTMSSEDFPALPGTRGEVSSPGGTISDKSMLQTSGADGGADHRLLGHSDNGLPAKQDIVIYPDGKVQNIPASMINDQFGIVGLLAFIRSSESDSNLVSLALGQDLTTIGLNLTSQDNLHPTFGGPWSDYPCRPQDIDYQVPPEYLINYSIRDKLAPFKLNRYKDDVLFFLFYNSVGDILQLMAASELYNREWRYHMEEKVWITQGPGLGVIEKTATYERGTYYFFDAQNWRKVPKEFHLDYSKLESRPIFQTPPNQFLANN